MNKYFLLMIIISLSACMPEPHEGIRETSGKHMLKKKKKFRASNGFSKNQGFHYNKHDTYFRGVNISVRKINCSADIKSKIINGVGKIQINNQIFDVNGKDILVACKNNRFDIKADGQLVRSGFIN